jgi:hemoglobin
MADPTLYERLGGVYAIAAVIDRFSDRVVENKIAGRGSANPALNEWSTNDQARLPGLKWMRTLWVCAVAGGPYQYIGTKPGHNALALEEAHRDLAITSGEFDAVAQVLAETLDSFGIPAREKGEVLAAFAAHQPEVIEGSQVHGA